jgi:hypothetical protein
MDRNIVLLVAAFACAFAALYAMTAHDLYFRCLAENKKDPELCWVVRPFWEPFPVPEALSVRFRKPFR